MRRTTQAALATLLSAITLSNINSITNPREIPKTKICYHNPTDNKTYSFLPFNERKILVELPNDRYETAKVNGYLERNINPPGRTERSTYTPIPESERKAVRNLVLSKGHKGKIIFR